MPVSELTALSPLDGRYAERLEALRALFSELGLIRKRVGVEVAWFQHLASERGVAELPALAPESARWLEALAGELGPGEAQRIKDIERRTNHDVKAVEYYLKERLAEQASLRGHAEFIHFGVTSEDVNNLAYALMLAEARAEILLPAMEALHARLVSLAQQWAAQPMLARTHGQPASPTTMGKEFAVFAARLERERSAFERVAVRGKLNGAVGNFNALQVAYPELDWPAISARFVDHLGLENNPLTTQIEPHDWMAAYFDALARFNTVLVDLCRDLWGYIGLGYLRQAAVPGEVGSSTMPHKINPIDFENAEGNLGVANALLRHFSAKLPVSRWQRDLSDSTVLRSVGVALGHATLAYGSALAGLGRIEPDPARMAAELDAHWEVLAEAVQTLLRRHGVAEPYEQLKALTRGQRVSATEMHAFIRGLAIPDAVRERLLALTPADYVGAANALARRLKD